MPHSHRRLGCSILLFLLLACPLTATQAGVLEDAQQQWLLGQRAQAVQQLQAAVQATPGDAKLRFGLAVMQQESGQLALAEGLLRALTQDFPDMADPFNNLAVVLAGQGDLQGAQTALMRAVTLNPDHHLAHENLGDVLLQLAVKAYQAAQKPGGPASAALKLQKSRELVARLNEPLR